MPKNSRGPALLDRQHAVHRDRIVDDVDVARLLHVQDRDPIEVQKFSGDAAEIVPAARQDRFDFLRRFLREGRGQVRARDAVLPQPWSEPAHGGGQDVRRALAVAAPQQPHQDDHDPADEGMEDRAQAPQRALVRMDSDVFKA